MFDLMNLFVIKGQCMYFLLLIENGKVLHNY